MAYRMPRILAPAVLMLVTASAAAGQTPDSLATALQIPAPAARSEGVLALYGNPAGLAFGPTVEAGMAFAGLTSSAWRSRTLMTKLGPFAYGRELFSSGDRELLNQAFGIGLRLGPRLAVGWGREWRSGRENVTSLGFLSRHSALVLASDLRSWELGGIAYAAHRYGVSAELFRGAVWLGWQYEDTYTEGRRGEKPLHLFETVYLSLRPLKGLSLTVRHSPESWYAGLGIGMGRLSAGGWYGADRDTEAKAGQISWLTLSDRNYETILPRAKRWVSLRLGALPPEEPTRLFGIFTLEKETLLDLLLFFEELRVDEAVAGVILDLRGLSGGWAGLQEVREALVRLKDAGKEVLAYGESPGMGALYVASAAESLFVPPSGLVNLTGLAYQLPFYADLFEKIGVRAEFVRIDQYKTAPETYTRSEPTAANIEMRNWLLDSLEDQFFEALSEGRGVTTTEARDWLDHGPYTAAEALESGVVDAVAWPDQVFGAGGKARGGRPVQSRAVWEREREAPREWIPPVVPRIAVVHATGAIVSGSSGRDLLQGSLMGADTIVEALQLARADPSVAAVVLRVDSPGGSALASDLIWRETVRDSGSRKPIVVSMGDVAASGGYYISAGADAIFARPGTITGSIGIYGGKFDLSGLYEKIGYNVVRMERGRFAGSMSETRGFTEEERARLQEVLQQGYDMFVGRVAAGRGMSYEQVDAIGRGRVWTGEQALERGLVDRLGGLIDAVDEARRLAGLAGRRVEIVRLPETSFGPADLTVGRIVKETASVLGLSDQPEAGPVQELTLLQPLRDALVHWEILNRLAGEQRFCLIEPALLPPREPW